MFYHFIIKIFLVKKKKNNQKYTNSLYLDG